MLRLDDHVDTHNTVRDVLKDKHPPSQLAYPDSIIEDDPSD